MRAPAAWPHGLLWDTITRGGNVPRSIQGPVTADTAETQPRRAARGPGLDGRQKSYDRGHDAFQCGHCTPTSATAPPTPAFAPPAVTEFLVMRAPARPIPGWWRWPGSTSIWSTALAGTPVVRGEQGRQRDVGPASDWEHLRHCIGMIHAASTRRVTGGCEYGAVPADATGLLAGH